MGFKYYKYEYIFILGSSKLMEMIKVVKSQNVDFFTLKSQTLTSLIYKCDLDFEKINVDSCSEDRN